MLRVVEHARAPIQHQLQGCRITCRIAGVEPDAGLGFGQPFAQQQRQVPRIVQGLFYRRACKFKHGRRQLPGLVGRRLIPVAVRGIAHQVVRVIGHALEQLSYHFIGRRLAKTDRVRHAFALGHAVVRPARRQVEHVARLQHVFLLGLEISQNFQRQPFDQAQVLLPPDAPAPPAVRLQQKHVVAVEMRADAAAVAGVADHQIVEARIRHKAKLLQQGVRALVVQIDALHQQRPVALRQRRQGAARQRPAFELPAVGAANDQPRFHGRVSGQREQLGARQKRLNARHGLAHQQRLFLPMALHEAGRRQAAQQWQGLIDIHGASIRKAAYPLPAMRQSAPWKSAPNPSSPSPGP